VTFGGLSQNLGSPLSSPLVTQLAPPLLIGPTIFSGELFTEIKIEMIGCQMRFMSSYFRNSGPTPQSIHSLLTDCDSSYVLHFRLKIESFLTLYHRFLSLVSRKTSIYGDGPIGSNNRLGTWGRERDVFSSEHRSINRTIVMWFRVIAGQLRWLTGKLTTWAHCLADWMFT